MAKRGKPNSTHSKPPRPGVQVAVRIALVAVIAALIVAGAWLGAVRLWDAITSRPEFRLNLRGLALTGCPEWVDCDRMTLELRKQLKALPEAASLFESDVATAVQHELRACPWVLDVTEVQRTLPDKLIIKATFRKPVAVALWQGERYLLDREAYWLPDDVFRPPEEWQANATPVIEDQLLRDPPAAGCPWNSPRMEVGARLSAFLRGRGVFDELTVTSIDVTGVGRRSTEPDIVLHTAGGAVVKWGQSSVYEQVEGLEALPSAMPDAQKVEMLLSKLSEYPGLQGVEYLDLRFHGKVYSLPSAQPPSAGP